uniref:Uncharacterized protein n=1 Tax=Melanopsichium pennsylvanicum 4 TaxID=1398559 RepID=A0A077QXP6_9BASI|nr:uncharacterized protein BN887_01599 [Melanopsichium pennsylvanicum 4]
MNIQKAREAKEEEKGRVAGDHFFPYQKAHTDYFIQFEAFQRGLPCDPCDAAARHSTARKVKEFDHALSTLASENNHTPSLGYFRRGDISARAASEAAVPPYCLGGSSIRLSVTSHFFQQIQSSSPCLSRPVGQSRAFSSRNT